MSDANSNPPPVPNIAAREAAVLELEPGTYWWCRCGLSKDQPWCDGSHNTVTGFEPLEFTVTEKKRVKLCQCKHTKTPPYCDQSHKNLPD